MAGHGGRVGGADVLSIGESALRVVLRVYDTSRPRSDTVFPFGYELSRKIVS